MKSINVKFFGFCMLFLFLNAFTQNFVSKSTDSIVIKPSLAECRTARDSAVYYRANTHVNISLIRLHARRYFNWRRINGVPDSIIVRDSLKIDSIILTFTPPKWHP